MKKIESKDRLFLLISIFFSILTTLLNYAFGDSDHLEQLPILYRFTDSHYLVNDFFVNSNNGFSPRFYFVKMIAFLQRFISIPSLYLILTFFSNSLLAILTYLVSLKLFKNSYTSLISVALTLSIFTLNIGSSGFLFGSLFIPSTLAFPLITLAFYFSLQKKLFWSLLICGFVAIFHVLIGTEYAFLFLGIHLLWNLFFIKNYKKAAILLGFSFIPLLFSLPTVIPYYQQKSSISSEDFIKIVAFFRHPHHYIASSFLTLKEVVKLFSFGFIFVLLFKKWQEKEKNFFLVFQIKHLFIITLLLGFFGWFFVEIIPLKIVTTLQLFRLFNLLKWMVVLFMAHFITQFLQQKNYKDVCLAFFSSINPLLFLFFILKKDFLTSAKIKKIATLILILFIGYFLLKFGERRIFVLFFMSMLLLHLKKKKMVFLLLGLGVILTTISFKKSYTQKKWITKNYLTYVSLPKPQQELVTFIKNNTKKEALFLTPPHFGFFRIYAKRAIIVDYKAFPFENDAIKEWYRRIISIYGNNQNNFAENYQNLTDDKLKKLQQKYLFNFAVLDIRTTTQYPVIYKNKKYKIIKTSY